MAAREHPTRSGRLTTLLGWIGKHGRWCLVLGLLGGLTLPSLAEAMRPWLPHLIALLLFVSAYRIGPKAALGGLQDLGASLRLALIYQLAAPLLALGLLSLLGLQNSAPGIALILVLAAPSVTGSPNFTIMMRQDPTAAMRLLLTGTALFPLTAIPVLYALPAIPTLGGVIEGAARLLLVVVGAVGLAFALRRNRSLSDPNRDALDGIAALLLGVLVIGLMSAIGPALRDSPGLLALWFAFALAVNFGLQIAARLALPETPGRTGLAVIAGNRNIALFLVALPEELVAQLLIFIGCYQVPMYLTPIVMRRFLAPNS